MALVVCRVSVASASEFPNGGGDKTSCDFSGINLVVLSLAFGF